ncbi:MAG TPA: hypothetical protein VIM18_08100 [Solirubrobacteraceae bacterium]
MDDVLLGVELVTDEELAGVVVVLELVVVGDEVVVVVVVGLEVVELDVVVVLVHCLVASCETTVAACWRLVTSLAFTPCPDRLSTAFVNPLAAVLAVPHWPELTAFDT